MRNTHHCSLAQTAFTERVYDTFRFCCTNKNVGPFVDLFFWTHWPGVMEGSALIMPHDGNKPLHVGMKGISWGLRGAGLGHDPLAGLRDGQLVQLRKWIGDDWLNYFDSNKKPR
jgi:hypothetical protein